MSVFRVAARPAPARPIGAGVRPLLGRAVQGLAIAGALTLGIAIALMLPGTARGADPAPAGVEDAYVAPHDGVLGVDAAGGVLANDTGVDLVAEPWTDPTSGDLELAADGGFVYTRTALARTDSFVYLATDRDGLATQPVRVTIRFANRPPACEVERVTGSPAGTLVELDLSRGCTDPDGDPLTFVYQQPDIPPGSLWEADELGHVRFLPPPDWTGTGTVVFAAEDGLGSSMPAALAVEVVEVVVEG